MHVTESGTVGATQMRGNLRLREGRETRAGATKWKKEKLVKIFTYFDGKSMQIERTWMAS